MRREAVTGLAIALGACASGGGVPPPPAPLAGDREQPVLALFEHVLTGYFAGGGAVVTTCARLSPTALSAEQEQALIVRFVRLAPAERCDTGGRETVDSITGDIAQVVQIYEFACPNPELCSGWVQWMGEPATRYAMRFEGGAWRFDSDRRIVAE